MRTVFKNATVLNNQFEWELTDLIFSDRIELVGKTDEDGIDLKGAKVIPGLYDQHTHGGVGVDMNDGKGYEAYRDYLYENGITHFLPTLVTASKEEYLRVMDYLKDRAEFGVNQEGPYITHEKAGAHSHDQIRTADAKEFTDIFSAAEGKIRLMTVAPQPENIPFIREATKLGVRVSLGHTTANYDETMAGIEAGGSILTHTFNAMPPLNHRDPGPIGASVDAGIFCEVISDGVHLHPSVVRMLYKMLGSDKMVLISDSMAATGYADGEYLLGELKITVKDSIARTQDGALAGSTTNLRKMVQNAIAFGIPETEAIKMATLTPARASGLDAEIGSIAVGKRADLVIVDDALNVKQVYLSGEAWNQ